jgi:tetratricopeptide (TPR) repeat protein
VYPERGVLFAFESITPMVATATKARKVIQIILEPITAEPFALRAETDIDSDLELSKRDIQQALKLQPDNARAHWLHSRIQVASGHLDEAAAAGRRAIALKSDNPRYRVTLAQILGQMGRLDEAISEAEKAVTASQRRRHVKARALCLLGDLTASGKQPNFAMAIDYHMRAVKEADPLVVDPHPAVRLAAKEVLIDAHLGAAHDIAWGNWNEKEKAVPRWLDRADAFIDDLIENEGGDQEYRFRAATRALAACVGVRGDLDPAKWADKAIRVGEVLIDESRDSRHKAQTQWDLGMALYDTLQIYQMRNDHTTALKYGEQAIKYLEQGHQQKNTTTTAYLLGRLYFRLGAIHAIRDENHKAAITWFDKAAPLLQKPIPADIYADIGRHGETFVSMGISYWESGQRDRAVDLTELGIRLMEKAVNQGTLDSSALAIPYGNLATMHRQLGNADEADRFESMAAQNGQTAVR